MASLVSELRRRNVFKVGAAYAVVGWIVVEIASVVLPGFGAPDWVLKVMMLVVILGFPFAVIFAWAYELTPEGLKREKDIDLRVESGHRGVHALAGSGNRLSRHHGQRRGSGFHQHRHDGRS